LAAAELGFRSLDAFLRLLVAHLSSYRHVTAHPSFDWTSLGAAPQAEIRYVFSVTHETEPARRQAKLVEYHADARKRMTGL
jgi:hypothetical protein